MRGNGLIFNLPAMEEDTGGGDRGVWSYLSGFNVF